MAYFDIDLPVFSLLMEQLCFLVNEQLAMVKCSDQGGPVSS